MPSTRPRVFVFDFDGTLVQSAVAKRQAFYEIFDAAHAPVVQAVLDADPDGSRHVVIPRIVADIARRGLPPAGSARDLINAYAAVADRNVAAAREVPGATALLRRLADTTPVYVASTTPHEQLIGHLDRRGWTPFITEAFGYPREKTEIVAMLIARHGIMPAELLVVGDGVSDETAAAANGCRFHKITAPSDLAAIATLERADV